MSSFQLTKIRPISPSVRQPESAIGFWKTCSQKTRKVSNSPEAKAAQPLVYPGRDFAFLKYSVSSFSWEVKSNSLLALVTAVAISPKPVTSFWHRHHHLWSRDERWDLRAVQQKSIPMILKSIATQITLGHHTHPQSTHRQPACRTTASFRHNTPGKQNTCVSQPI